MMLGVLLGIAVSIFVTSVLFIFFELSGNFARRIATGAVIGSTGIVSYALISAIISFAISVFLILLIRDSVRGVYRKS